MGHIARRASDLLCSSRVLAALVGRQQASHPHDTWSSAEVGAAGCACTDRSPNRFLPRNMAHRCHHGTAGVSGRAHCSARRWQWTDQTNGHKSSAVQKRMLAAKPDGCHAEFTRAAAQLGSQWPPASPQSVSPLPAQEEWKGLPERPLRIVMVAGEPSGDDIGAALMRSLQATAPHGVTFMGVGGPRMEQAGMVSVVPMQSLAVMGFTELIPALYSVYKAWRQVTDGIQSNSPPDAIVTIDYKGFNFRLLRWVNDWARKTGHPCPVRVHYVAPSVWAVRTPEHKMRRLSSLVDEMLCILPFEPKIWRKVGVKATYVGHPVLEPAAKVGGHKEELWQECPTTAGDTSPLICLLPGSRLQEVTKHVPLFRDTVLLLRKSWPQLQCVLPCVPDLRKTLEDLVEDWPCQVALVSSQDCDEVFRSSTIALACSGSVVCQVAAAGLPVVVAYKASLITEWIVRSRVLVKYASLPNIVLSREAIPEALFSNATPEILAMHVEKLLASADAQKRQRLDFSEFVNVLMRPLDGTRPSLAAAACVLRQIQSCQQ